MTFFSTKNIDHVSSFSEQTIDKLNFPNYLNYSVCHYLVCCYKDGGVENMYFEPEDPDEPLPIEEDDISADEVDDDDDDDMPTSESSDHITGK